MALLVTEPIAVAALRAQVQDPACGGFVCFEGWVRDHNAGKPVTALEYEAYVPMAEKVLADIVAQASERFAVRHVAVQHRIGLLHLQDLAVWVGVSAPHRGPAFAACQYVIDTLKRDVPIWKCEHYAHGERAWVACHHCGA